LNDIEGIKNGKPKDLRAAIRELTENGVAGGSLLRMARINADALKFVRDTASVMSATGTLNVKADGTFDLDIPKTRQLLRSFAGSMEEQARSLKHAQRERAEEFKSELAEMSVHLNNFQESVTELQRLHVEHGESLAHRDSLEHACAVTEAKEQATRTRVADMRKEYVGLASEYEIHDAHWALKLESLNAPRRLALALVAVWEARRREVSEWLGVLINLVDE
jgi:hypothetical protein